MLSERSIVWTPSPCHLSHNCESKIPLISILLAVFVGGWLLQGQRGDGVVVARWWTANPFCSACVGCSTLRPAMFMHWKASLLMLKRKKIHLQYSTYCKKTIGFIFPKFNLISVFLLSVRSKIIWFKPLECHSSYPLTIYSLFFQSSFQTWKSDQSLEISSRETDVLSSTPLL